MKNACSYLALLAMTLLCAPSFAQTGALKKGDKFYENMVYPQATRQYEKGLKKTQDLRSMERLADAYEQLSNLDMAERWYAKVVTLKGTAPANLMHYGMVLKANGNYAEARKWFNAYAHTNQNPAAAARML
jgi:tetratricopeptide (TPR) repeat protein